MTNEELMTKPTEIEIAMVIERGHGPQNDMIRRLSFQLDMREAFIRRAIVGLKNIGTFRYGLGADPHPLDCSLAGRVAHVFGMGMTRACELVRHHGENPAYVNDPKREDDDAVPSDD